MEQEEAPLHTWESFTWEKISGLPAIFTPCLQRTTFTGHLPKGFRWRERRDRNGLWNWCSKQRHSLGVTCELECSIQLGCVLSAASRGKSGGRPSIRRWCSWKQHHSCLCWWLASVHTVREVTWFTRSRSSACLPVRGHEAKKLSPVLSP